MPFVSKGRKRPWPGKRGQARAVYSTSAVFRNDRVPMIRSTAAALAVGSSRIG